jgi:coproporphyrinogen III oxidase
MVIFAVNCLIILYYCFKKYAIIFNMHLSQISNNQKQASSWFENLRNHFISILESIENKSAEFEITPWNKSSQKDEGGGQMALMRGKVFEKVGVNISTVHSTFSPEFRKQIPGAEETGEFFASGISFVAHPFNPFAPIAHFNTRFITTTKAWFGGGGDLTPIFPLDDETKFFHSEFEDVCNKHNKEYYPKYKKWCDEYFFLPHRNESRGVGGIFYDYLYAENDDDFQKHFAFTKDVGTTFLKTYAKIIEQKKHYKFTDADKEKQYIKRARYVEFNLIYDRGTKFGLATGGNTEAILMSLPPVAKWS